MIIHTEKLMAKLEKQGVCILGEPRRKGCFLRVQRHFSHRCKQQGYSSLPSISPGHSLQQTTTLTPYRHTKSGLIYKNQRLVILKNDLNGLLQVRISCDMSQSTEIQCQNAVFITFQKNLI